MKTFKSFISRPPRNPTPMQLIVGHHDSAVCIDAQIGTGRYQMQLSPVEARAMAINLLIHAYHFDPANHRDSFEELRADLDKLYPASEPTS